MSEDPTRTLSDSDVDAIALRLKEHFVNDLYKDIGKGVWGSIRAAIMWVALAVAVYFAAKGQSLRQ